MSIKGPCIVCGKTDYNLSMGGPTICPACDCGHFGIAEIQSQRDEILRLRAAIASHEAGAQADRDHVIEECAKVAEDRIGLNRKHRLWRDALEAETIAAGIRALKSRPASPSADGGRTVIRTNSHPPIAEVIQDDDYSHAYAHGYHNGHHDGKAGITEPSEPSGPCTLTEEEIKRALTKEEQEIFHGALRRSGKLVAAAKLPSAPSSPEQSDEEASAWPHCTDGEISSALAVARLLNDDLRKTQERAAEMRKELEFVDLKMTEILAHTPSSSLRSMKEERSALRAIRDKARALTQHKEGE